MKNLKAYKTIAIALMVVFSSTIFAQAKKSNDIPSSVVVSLTKKYPDVRVKTWKVNDNLYTAKVIIDNHKYFATFDQNGNWLTTTSKISWPWSLPANIRSSYKKTQYGAWNIFMSKKVEKPSGEFYQLWVRSRTSTIPYPHPYTMKTDKVLEFKADGELASVNDMSDDGVTNF